MTGILFGTGIGPGDPELMTLKAVRLIRENDTIAVPGEKPKESIAYQIAVQAVPEKEEKELYQERLYVGRTADQKEKFAKEQPYYPESPRDLVSPSELIR